MHVGFAHVGVDARDSVGRVGFGRVRGGVSGGFGGVGGFRDFF